MNLAEQAMELENRGCMTGADLRCECGQPAKDVSADYPISPNTAVSWHCIDGHLNISGHRPGYVGFQQERFDESEVAA